jgi:histidinol-phosphate aminotransferase
MGGGMTCDPLSLVDEGVRGLTPYQPGKSIEELERELGLTHIIKLASNESPLGPSPMARAMVLAGLDELSRYPDGGGTDLRAALADSHDLAGERFTLGNGSNDILELIARLFVSAEHEVVFSEHAFAVYPLVTHAIGASAVEVPARDRGHDLAAMADAITESTRLVFIANPNNPTGTWSDAEALERFLAAVPDRVIVVVDQAYAEYVDEPGYPDCISWLSRHSNLIVTRTFSKAHGLAGLRIGYGVSSADIAELLNRVRQPFNVNSLALAAAAASLEDHEHLARSVAINRSGMRQLRAGFDAMGIAHIPSVANFICFAVPGDAADVYTALLREGVIVRPVASYGLPRHLRVTVGLADENARFLQALEGVIEKVIDGA